MEKPIIRKCIGCFQDINRDELIKITREHKTQNIIINPNSEIFGRSVYLCYNNSCVEKAFKKNKLAKFLKAETTQETKKEIQSIINQ